MRAFAFDKIQEGFPHCTAVSKEVDRDPWTEDWFRERLGLSRPGGGTWCTPLEPWMLAYYPTTVIINSNRFELSPWVVYASHWGVSRAVRAVIESLEPDKHQFIPIKLKYGTDGQFKEHEYFTLQVNALVDDVDVEKSDVNWQPFYDGTGRYWTPKHLVPVVLPESSISRLHLWRNQRISKWMMSGVLLDALERCGLARGLKFEEHFVV